MVKLFSEIVSPSKVYFRGDLVLYNEIYAAGHVVSACGGRLRQLLLKQESHDYN